jgi:ABC-type sugar transport system, periplasmic component
MKKRMRLAAVGGVAIAGLVLAGCTPGDNGGGSDEPVTLSISSWQWAEPTRGDQLWSVFENVAAELGNVTLERVDLPYSETQDTLSTQLGAGSGPDIVFTVEAFFQPLARAGLFADLNELGLSRDSVDDLRFQNEWGEIDGHQYGYVSELANTAMTYNQRLLDEAGVGVPTTWEELLAAAEAVEQKTDAYGFATRHLVEEASGMFLQFKSWVHGHGGDFSENGKLTLNSPEVVEAAEHYAEIYASGAMPVGVNVAVQREMFIEEDVAILFQTNGDYFAQLSTNPALREITGVAPLPFPEPETVGVTLFISVNNASPNKEAAAEVVRGFLSQTAQDEWIYPMGGSLGPLDLPLPDDLLAENPWISAFEVQGQHAQRLSVAGFEEYMPQLTTIVTDALLEIMIGGVDAKTALDAAQAEAEALVG